MKQMEETKNQIDYKGHLYNMVFNINVVEAIQKEYKSFDNWVNLVRPKGKEADLKALKFAFMEALNEGIDIENEDNNTQIEFLNEKQVGRIITEYGVGTINQKLQKAVVESTENDNSKNE